MAIVTTTPSSAKDGWIVNATSADASGNEELKAAPNPGEVLIIDQITINNGAAALSHTINQTDDTGSPQVVTALLGAIAMAVNTSKEFVFPMGLMLDEQTSLTIDASGSGTVCVVVQGRTKIIG